MILGFNKGGGRKNMSIEQSMKFKVLDEKMASF